MLIAKPQVVLFIVMMLTLLGGVVLAGPFTNGSFELGTGPETKFAGDTSITGWVVLAHSIDWAPGWYWQAQEGSRSLDLSGQDAGGIQQTFDSIAGHAYQVAFYIAGNVEGAPVIKHMQVLATGNTAQGYTFDTTGRGRASMGWREESYLFLANGPTTTLQFTSQDNTGWGPFLDSVSLQDLGVGQVPEPAALGLAGTGLAVMLLLRRHLIRAAQ